MVSQRACLDFAIEQTTRGMSGPVFELGLGNGRTYHHMIQYMSDIAQFIVFERAVASHPGLNPARGSGDSWAMCGTLCQPLWIRFGATASLIHADLGGHNRKKNDAFARFVSPLIEPFLAEGGLMVSSDRMYFDGLTELSLPPGAVEGRCFIYRR